MRSSPTAAGRVDARVDVGLCQLLDQAGLDGVVGPDAGEAVGLQLGADGASLRPAALTRTVQRPEQVLDVVPVLVRQHVGLGERPTLGAEARLQLVEEAEVDVDVLVGRAVERADLGARGAAARRTASV